MIKILGFIFAVSLFVTLSGHRSTDSPADIWVDSVFNSLSRDQRIAQLMVIRGSAIDPKTRKPILYYNEVIQAIRKYNIGGVCMFQGGPRTQAQFINRMQSIAKTPLMICIDAENGLGMRMDSVIPLPRQMMLGAVQDPSLIYDYGQLVGEQCKRIGIQVNYAPVVDVNNNANNPVINDRSFGENKFLVAQYGIEYMRGMQDVGVMACAKHFPGHGDVDVDSHYDLPIINKTKTELDSLELYPFRQIVNAGVGSVMIAHLYIPAIDSTRNRATSLSYNNVTKLLRDELGFRGLTFTDALEMKGVTKFFPAGEASVQSIIAGNDMLCLPGDIPGSIKKIKDAIKNKKLTWDAIDEKVKRVLYAKYQYGVASWQPVIMENLVKDLNKGITEMRQRVAENAITLLRNSDPAIFPLARGQRVAYVAIGESRDNMFARQLREDYDAHAYYFNYNLSDQKATSIAELLKDQYDVVVIGVHNYSRFPANNFGISRPALSLIDKIQRSHKSVTFAFGNPYAIKNFCDSRVLVACYEDDDITQSTAADLLYGRFNARGKLPVTVCESLRFGTGYIATRLLPSLPASELGFDENHLDKIDSIMYDAIDQRAIPGGVVMVVKDGKIAYERAFGFLTYAKSEPVYPETIYDLASVTKIMATTLAVMKLYDEGRLDLKKKLKHYLPWVKNTDKEDLVIWDILLHQAGLKAWIPFYRETIDSIQAGEPSYAIYSSSRDSMYNIRVAENLYMRNDWVDTMQRRILLSELSQPGRYVYSDNDFIFLGKIVEAITKMPLDKYVKNTFYDKLNLSSTGFKPRERFPTKYIAPTEEEMGFRRQLIHGDVHDPGAAMFGGVAGHAGLFGNAYDLAVLSQLLLNGGHLNGIKFFKKETVDLFTAYHSDGSRRGLGFDKPERDNDTRESPYPALSASPQTYGHTGFTGTCVWIDPAHNLTFILLSNRVHNNGDANRFLRMNVRGKAMEVVYEALKK